MKLNGKSLILAMMLLVLPTGLAHGQANDSYKKLLGADTIISSQKVDVNKDGKSEMLVYYSKDYDAFMDLVVNNTSVFHSDMGMKGEFNQLKVTDIGKAGLIIENNVHFGGSGGPSIGVFHLKPDYTLTNVKADAEPQLSTDRSKNIIVSTDKLTTKYQVVLPASIKEQMPSQLSGNHYYYKLYGNQYKYTNGVAEITFVYSTTLSVISNSTMPFEVYQTYVLEKNKWVIKKLSVKDAYKSGVKISEIKPPIDLKAKPAAKVTIETLLTDGKLPDGLIVGKSTTKDIKKLYGNPMESYPFEGRIAMIYKNRTFMVSDETGVITMVAYNDQGSILGLTANKSNAKNVKATFGAKYTYSYDEEENEHFTTVYNKSKTRFIDISYDENDVVLSIAIGIK